MHPHVRGRWSAAGKSQTVPWPTSVPMSRSPPLHHIPYLPPLPKRCSSEKACSRWLSPRQRSPERSVNHNQRLLQFLEASAVLRGRCRCRGSVSRVSLCAGAATVATERSPFGPRSPIRSGQLNAASDWTYAYAYRDPRARYASLTAGVEPRRFRGGPGPSAGVDREAIEDAKLRRRHRREWPDRAAPHLLRPGGLRPPTRSLVGAANLTSHPEPRWHLPHHPPGRDPSHPTHDSQPSAHPSI